MRTLARVLPIGLACFATAAQDTTRATGPALNVHYVHTSGVELSARDPFNNVTYGAHSTSSSGVGFTLAYGLDRWLGVYANVDQAGGQSIADTLITGTLSPSQLDAGIRGQWPLSRGRVVPYALLAYTYSVMRGPATRPLLSADSGIISTWGPALTYGLGIELFVSPRFALDLSYAGSSVKYRYSEFGDTHAPPTTMTRMSVGGTFQIGPLGPRPPAPSADTAAVGMKVRVHAGRSVLAGSVLLIRPDTLFLQEVHHDTTLQVSVPRACVTRMEREVPAHSAGSGAANGAVGGAIAGAFIGILRYTNLETYPGSPGSILGRYSLVGAVVGAGVGALVGRDDTDWQSLALPPRAAAAPAECGAWHGGR